MQKKHAHRSKSLKLQCPFALECEFAAPRLRLLVSFDPFVSRRSPGARAPTRIEAGLMGFASHSSGNPSVRR